MGAAGCSHTVTIKSEPPGAEIFVDGQSKGMSPVSYEEKSSGGGSVDIKARLNGQEVTKTVERSEINWAAVGGAGGGPSAFLCLGLNATGCGSFFFLGPFAIPFNCLGLAVLPVGPAIAYFVGGKQLPDTITIDMRSAEVGPALEPDGIRLADSVILDDDGHSAPQPPPPPDAVAALNDRAPAAAGSVRY
jgi:hypothetical protein